jgi:hypothetical protein
MMVMMMARMPDIIVETDLYQGVYSGIEHSIDKISYKFATTDLGIIICSFQ